MTEPTRIVLCRHGVTDFTVTGRWDGRGGQDPELNDEGRAQAADLADRLAAFLGPQAQPRLISSTLKRAQQTAEPAAARFATSVTALADWDELAFGDWDGKSEADLMKQCPDDLKRYWVDATYRIPGGEAHVHLHARVRAAFETLVNSEGTTVVFTHWWPIMSCIAVVLGIDMSGLRRFHLAPTAMTSFDIGPLGPQVEFINDLGARPR